MKLVITSIQPSVYGDSIDVNFEIRIPITAEYGYLTANNCSSQYLMGEKLSYNWGTATNEGYRYRTETFSVKTEENPKAMFSLVLNKIKSYKQEMQKIIEEQKEREQKIEFLQKKFQRYMV